MSGDALIAVAVVVVVALIAWGVIDYDQRDRR